MGIFNHIGDTKQPGATPVDTTHFDVVLSDYATKIDIEKTKKEIQEYLRRTDLPTIGNIMNTDLDMGGNRIINLRKGEGQNQVPTLEQISENYLGLLAQKDLNMNEKYIRGLKTDISDSTSAVNKKALQDKIDIQKRLVAQTDKN